jgi:ribose-phosphate pyrophosphokinase
MSSELPILVFSTERYGYLGDRLCALDGFEGGEVERKLFPDGEVYERIRTACGGRDVALIGGTISELDTLMLYDLAGALVQQGAHTLTLVIPYYGYQTMERSGRPGEVVTAKTRARLLSSIPVAGSGNRIVLVDLHAEGITHYFEGNVRPVHLRATPVVLREIRRVGGDGFIVGATDAGRAKWVEFLANALGVDAAFVFKRRLSGKVTEVTALAADVSGRPVVIYDDMIRTGSSLLGAARAYRDAGATSIAAVTTHGVFPGDSLRDIEASGLFTTIVCTDTHPRAVELEGGPFLDVVSVAKLLAEHLRGRA